MNLAKSESLQHLVRGNLGGRDDLPLPLALAGRNAPGILLRKACRSRCGLVCHRPGCLDSTSARPERRIGAGRSDRVFSCRITGAKTRSVQGIGLIEIVVAVAIISVSFLGFYQLLIMATRPIEQNVRAAQAAYLAQEGIEAVRTLRNVSWAENIATLTDEASYFAAVVNGNWSLATSDPGSIDGTYTRTITVHKVFRDSDDNISDTGTLDDKTKKVDVAVSWNEHGQSESVTLATYITDFLSN